MNRLIVHEVDYDNVDEVEFLPAVINAILEETKQLSGKLVFDTLKRNVHGRVSPMLYKITYRLINDVVKFVNNSNLTLSASTVWVDDLIDVRQAKSEKIFVSGSYNGPFDWEEIQKYYYKIYTRYRGR